MIRSDPTLLGTVEDVSGPTIRVKLGRDTVSGLSFIEGQSYRVGQVGGFIRIPLGFANLYGVISQVGASAVPERLAEVEIHGNRWMTIQLVGEGQPGARFDRGISQFPTVGDTAHLVTEADLRMIYGRPNDDRFVQVGHLASASSIPALIEIDKLVTRHSAVLGTTGSGKSTTVAGLLAALSDRICYPSARILVIDIHGEYGKALQDRAAIFRINPDTRKGERPLYIPYWAMTLDELLPITFGTIENAGDRGAVIDRIMALKLEGLGARPRPGVDADTLSVDTPVPFSMHKLWFDLHCEMRSTHVERDGQAQSRETWALERDPATNKAVQEGSAIRGIPPRFRAVKDIKGDPEKIRHSRSPLSISRQIDALGSKIRDPRFDFLLRPGPYCPAENGSTEQDLDTLLADWLGDRCPITILDLSNIPPSIQSELVGAVLRIVYDALYWARNIPEGGRERPLLVVLEEAHAYLNEKQIASTAVRRIAKEGRKYGIGMMLVSQRPAEIDQTILSQCGTLFALRLNNAEDRNHVKGAASDNLDGLFAMLPILRTGEAVIIGEAVNLPIRTLINPPSNSRRPDSADPKVVVAGSKADGYEGPGGWNQKQDPANYSEAVELWRRQNPRPSNVFVEAIAAEFSDTGGTK
ncbi:ATP-binding protein [Bradyrhizobium huanghuaihaiense]|uniref:ATP-binding protein n=1 Tax=Bradyrhizobium huanghuaihaiense TaxID=990078 RepID=UPI0021A97E10|nr:ATP-binding protein [Bradyrhizobium sp. CB3035]UWU75569.1 ATP-binding protein [Bradyrhizobium sp. CB3035]